MGEGLWRGGQGKGSQKIRGRGSEGGREERNRISAIGTSSRDHNGEMAALNSEHCKQIDLIPLYATAHRFNAFPDFMRSFDKGSFCCYVYNSICHSSA